MAGRILCTIWWMPITIPRSYFSSSVSFYSISGLLIYSLPSFRIHSPHSVRRPSEAHLPLAIFDKSRKGSRKHLKNHDDDVIACLHGIKRFGNTRSIFGFLWLLWDWLSKVARHPMNLKTKRSGAKMSSVILSFLLTSKSSSDSFLNLWKVVQVSFSRVNAMCWTCFWLLSRLSSKSPSWIIHHGIHGSLFFNCCVFIEWLQLFLAWRVCYCVWSALCRLSLTLLLFWSWPFFLPHLWVYSFFVVTSNKVMMALSRTLLLGNNCLTVF